MYKEDIIVPHYVKQCFSGLFSYSLTLSLMMGDVGRNSACSLIQMVFWSLWSITEQTAGEKGRLPWIQICSLWIGFLRDTSFVQVSKGWISVKESVDLIFLSECCVVRGYTRVDSLPRKVKQERLERLVNSASKAGVHTWATHHTFDLTHRCFLSFSEF